MRSYYLMEDDGRAKYHGECKIWESFEWAIEWDLEVKFRLLMLFTKEFLISLAIGTMVHLWGAGSLYAPNKHSEHR